MPAPMVRKQIYLTPELDERLRRAAARQRRSEAEVLREAGVGQPLAWRAIGKSYRTAKQ